MTVYELIQLLRKHPPDLRVVVDGYEDGYDDLSPEQLQTVKITLNTGTLASTSERTAMLTSCPRKN